MTTGVPVYIGVDARNQWPYAATLEAVRLIEATPGIRLVEVRLVRPGATPFGGIGIGSGSGAFIEELGMFAIYEPLPRSLPGNNDIQDGRMWIAVIADQPGEQSFETVALDYRVGPFSFSADLHMGFGGCIDPMPEGAVCSWDAH